MMSITDIHQFQKCFYRGLVKKLAIIDNTCLSFYILTSLTEYSFTFKKSLKNELI